MNILGLHFGHDAGVSVLREGRVASCIVRERFSRAKHAVTLQIENIDTALEAAGLGPGEIDLCAITSTQAVELIIDDPGSFSISFARHPNHSAPSTLVDIVTSQHLDPAQMLGGKMLEFLYANGDRSNQYPPYAECFPEHRGKKRPDFAPFGWMDHMLRSNVWSGHSLAQLGQTDFSSMVNDRVRHGFHYPVTVTFRGRAIPSYFIGHHMAHAAGCFYRSGFDDAAILSHDGYWDGDSDLSGMFFWGKAGRIFPITPHYLTLGVFYDGVGMALGLGQIGPAGKLMGLSAYGEPRFFHSRFVGNFFDWRQKGINGQTWLDHCRARATDLQYDLEPAGDRMRATAPINADVAASTQKLFEETYLAAVEALSGALDKAGLRTNRLCLTGGTALNCPSNTRVARESRFREVFVEPGCDDSGLAVGAALWLSHNVFDQPTRAPEKSPMAAYLGLERSVDEAALALQQAGDALEFSLLPENEAAAAAADDLMNDRVIGWYEGRSEIGPRALGHRSILANARFAENWPRVNRIKGRESWRPFAPAVLESEAGKWFRGLPAVSPYMLFTGMVRSTEIPAVTHFDGSARVQTVSEPNGVFFQLLMEFFRRSGIPVILNTSFNGPGEPIVESPKDAIDFFLRSELDALYLCGFRVIRRRASTESARAVS